VQMSVNINNWIDLSEIPSVISTHIQCSLPGIPACVPVDYSLRFCSFERRIANPRCLHLCALASKCSMFIGLIVDGRTFPCEIAFSSWNKWEMSRTWDFSSRQLINMMMAWFCSSFAKNVKNRCQLIKPNTNFRVNLCLNLTSSSSNIVSACAFSDYLKNPIASIRCPINFTCCSSGTILRESESAIF
jgi:hypothetical protein